MKREELKALELSDDVIDKIMEMNGADINREKAGIDDYKKQISERDNTISAITTERDGFKSQLDGFKDYDSIKKELDEMKSKESDRLLEERFNTVLGENKVKNKFTRDGLFNEFKTKLELPEMKGQKDEDIFKGIVNGHEQEFFEGKVQIKMSHVQDPQGGDKNDDPERVFGVKIIRG